MAFKNVSNISGFFSLSMALYLCPCGAWKKSHIDTQVQLNTAGCRNTEAEVYREGQRHQQRNREGRGEAEGKCFLGWDPCKAVPEEKKFKQLFGEMY